MVSLVIAALFFDGIHFFISGTVLRAKLVSKIGERAFRAVFSLLSLVGIIWLSRAYTQADSIVLWGEIQGLQPLALIIMLIAFFFVVFAFTSPNPTAVGGEVLLKERQQANGVFRITRHPFLWGVVLWAFVHLLVNGDLASVIFFATFLVLALGGALSIDRKRKKALGDAWDRFARVTSNVPFLAVLQGRNSVKIGELGWWRVMLAVVFYGLFLGIHRWLFGASPFAS